MKYSIKDFQKMFPTDEACLEHVFNRRYGQGYPCPKCRKASWFKLKGRKAWSCGSCRHQIHPLAGTIFHKSNTSLVLWFFAMFKFANSRNGVAAKELERDLEVTYKTAWRIAKQIRGLMNMIDTRLSGTVEVDESFMEKIKGRGRKNTPQIIGLVERGGNAKALSIYKSGLVTSIPIIKTEVATGSTLMTDAAPMYKNKELDGYQVNSVNHSAGEYAFGSVHINTVEGFLGKLSGPLTGRTTGLASGICRATSTNFPGGFRIPAPGYLCFFYWSTGRAECRIEKIKESIFFFGLYFFWHICLTDNLYMP